MSKAHKGEKNSMYGKKHTEETRRKNSEAHKGKKNSNYIDGSSNEPYALEFDDELKYQIRERDNFICQYCGLKENGRAHCCHHINYDKKDSNENNLITLCTLCNPKANYDRDKWQFFFTILMESRYLGNKNIKLDKTRK